MPEGSAHQRPGGEWSAVETLRHLVFVHDSWFRRCCLGSTGPFTPIGLCPDYVPGQEEQGRWPPYARGKSVLECLHVVLNEEWAHPGAQ
jgi:hypothetical protein